VLVKHFEVALDERVPEQRQRLETGFWIMASDIEQYGVTYKMERQPERRAVAGFRSPSSFRS
jgi:hypothetical protein